MKKFKQFLNEERRRLYKWNQFPPSLLNPPQIPPPIPYRPNFPFQTNPYLEPPGSEQDPDAWNPYGGFQDWGFGFDNHNFEDLPPWLKALWMGYNFLDFSPFAGQVMDIWDLLNLIRMINEMEGLSQAEKEQLIRDLIQYAREKGLTIPDDIANNPPNFRKMFYEARPDGKFQLWRWNPSTRTWEPFGVPVDAIPDGWNGPILAPWQMPKMPGPGQGVIPSDFRPEDAPEFNPNNYQPDAPYLPAMSINNNQNQGQGGLGQFGG